MLQPLHALLNSKSKLQTITWNAEATAAFTRTKEALANATLLYYPKLDASTCLLTDASDIAVCSKHVEGKWHVISFFSKKLKPAETRYSTFDQELLAVCLASRHFRYFREGCPCADRPQASYFRLAGSSRPVFPRQTRQLDFISQFTLTL